MANGDIVGITSLATGWEDELTIAGLSTGGTYLPDAGSAVSAKDGAPILSDKSTAKYVTTVVSEGYDDTFTLGAVTRYRYGSRARMKAYPNQAQADERTSGGNLIATIACTERVYIDDNTGAGKSGTAPTTTLLSGFYTQGGTPSAAASSFAMTNNSTAVYPVTIARFVSYPGRLLGSNLDVEVMAYQYFGQESRPVRGVKFTATDSDGTSISEIVTTQTQLTTPAGMPKLWGYKASASLASLAQGKTVTVSAIAYPFIGDASSIADSGTSTTLTDNFHAQLHLLDRTGAYYKPFAYVDTSSNIPVSGSITGTLVAWETITQATSGAVAVVAGTSTLSGTGTVRATVISGTPDGTHVWTGGTSGATFTPSGAPVANGNTTGVVSTTAATARATPWANAWNAFKALRDAIVAFDATRTNDVNGATLRIMDCSAAWGRDGSITAVTCPSAWVVVERDPLVALAEFRAKASNAQHWSCKNMIFKNLRIRPQAAEQSAYLAPQTVTGYVFDTCYFKSEGSGTMLVANADELWMQACTSDGSTWGNGSTAAGHSANLRSHLGVSWDGATWSTNGRTVIGCRYESTTAGSNARKFWKNDTNFTAGCIVAFNRWISCQSQFIQSSTGLTSVAFVGNFTERVQSSVTPMVDMFDVNCANILLWHNTIAGERTNIQDFSSPNNTFEHISLKYNSFQYYAYKGDVFVNDGTLIGTWSLDYGVGCVGNHSAQATFPPRYEYLYTTGTDEGYVDDSSIDGTNVGFGDYTPNTGSPLIGKVPSGESVIPYDMNGLAIPSDGTGCGGAFQRTPSSGSSTRKGAAMRRRRFGRVVLCG